jgi:UDP-N-acetylmuramyl pentapeptide phosphotransferase/UDP-N-acetylglucosamine-1-phosphate transferase
MMWVIIAVSFLLSTWLTWRFTNPASQFYIVDNPNERSLHVRPMPRSGGIAILVAIGACGAAVVFFLPARDYPGVAISVLIVAIVSFVDDRYSVPPVYRLAAHVGASVLVIYSGFIPRILELPGVTWEWPQVIATLFSVVFIVWMVNLYNFMDGMDGFAGGMAVFGFGAFAIMGWRVGHETFFVSSLIVVASTAGFLIFNFPPARIFMGDVGSSSLGLLVGLFSLWGARDAVFPLWIALLVFSPFIVDATVTLISRLLRHEKIWLAHKKHYYQQLVQAGWGHRKTVLLEYAIMIACSITALWCIRASFVIQLLLLVFWGLFYSLFIFYVSRLCVRHKKMGIL